jgi:hypothetical protein
VWPTIFAQPAGASVDGAYVDDGGYTLAGAWDDRGADRLAEPCDDTTDYACTDDVELAYVVDFQDWLAESYSYRRGKASPGDVAE